MAIKRGEDGRIIEEETGKPKASNAEETRRLKGKMPPLPLNAKSDAASSGNSDKTVKVVGGKASNLKAEIEKNVRTIGEEHTRLVRPKKSDADQKDEEISLVVGWVVVLEGPGKGCSREIGYGNNTMGRSPSAAISLDFGDETISREKHCVLTYDPKGNNYFLSPGDSRNLVYVNEAPVLSPTVLKTGDKVGLGNSLLAFVAFCGDDFDWGEED